MANSTNASKPRRLSTRDSSLGDKIFDICNYTALTLLMIVTLYPFINTLAVSLNSAGDSIKGDLPFAAGVHVDEL